MKPRCQGHHDGGAHTSFLCVLDGLQGPGLLAGDHWEAVPSLTITGALDAANPRAMVTIQEVGP